MAAYGFGGHHHDLRTSWRGESEIVHRVFRVVGCSREAGGEEGNSLRINSRAATRNERDRLKDRIGSAMSKIFISYRRDDAGYVVGMVAPKLQDRFGKDAIFVDIGNIPFGIDFGHHISQAVAQCDVTFS